MQVNITNFRGIQDANFEIPNGGVVTISGGTGYGKTSICQAVRCATIGDWKLFPNMTKDQAKRVINRLAIRDEMEGKGKSVSECTIVDSEWDATISWSSQTTGGVGMSAHPSLQYLVGYKNICEMDAKISSEVLTTVLNLSPQKIDLITALPSIPEPQVQSIWDDIVKIGWESTCESQSAIGRSKKAQWESIAGIKYGSKKALQYFPEGWSPDMKSSNESKLREELVEAERRFEATVKVKGISEDRFDELTHKAELLEELQEEFRTISNSRSEQAKAVSEVQKQRDAIPQQKGSHTEKPLCCPSCNEELVLSGGALSKWVQPNKKDIDRRLALSTKLQQEVDKGTAMDRKMSELRLSIAEAEKAKEELKTAHVEDLTTNENLEKARMVYEKAKLRIEAFKKKIQADALHDEISEIAVIVTQLKADGVRKSVLNKKLVHFNDLLKKISPNINVSIDENLDFFVNGIPYWLASGGQKQYIQGVTQIALTFIAKTPLTVIDIDKMDNVYYEELLQIGNRAKFAVLIAGFGIPNPTHKIENDKTGMVGKLRKVKNEKD